MQYVILGYWNVYIIFHRVYSPTRDEHSKFINISLAMSGALPQQPEEFLDYVRTVPQDHVPTVDEELDEYLMLREVGVL